MKIYAELISNYEKQKIKNFCDNNLNINSTIGAAMREKETINNAISKLAEKSQLLDTNDMIRNSIGNYFNNFGGAAIDNNIVPL